MATTNGSLRDRLHGNYVWIASRVDAGLGGTGAPLSEVLERRILELRGQLTRVPAPPGSDEGSVRATVDAMTDSEVERTAEELYDIAVELECEQRAAEEHR